VNGIESEGEYEEDDSVKVMVSGDEFDAVRTWF
jgi:hypothetical protein